MRRNLDKTKLRLAIVAFFICLAAPTVVLVVHAYRQLKWETFYQYRVMAEELTGRIDDRFAEYVNREQQRSFTDYSFLVAAGDSNTGFLQRSPLSEYPPASDLPGLIGYFQIDANGRFSTPLLPLDVKASNYGINGEQLLQRRSVQDTIKQILSENRLMQPKTMQLAGTGPVESKPGKQSEETASQKVSPARSLDSRLSSGSGKTGSAPQNDSEVLSDEVKAEQQPAAQAAFDRLAGSKFQNKSERQLAPLSNIGRVEDLKLDEAYQDKLDREVLRKKQAVQYEDLAEPEEADIETQQPAQTMAPVISKRSAKKERRALPDVNQSMQSSALPAEPAAGAGAGADVSIELFENEIDPFDFSMLESGHLVLFRKVWHDGQRIIQGMILDQQSFVRQLIENAFLDTALSQMSTLAIAYEGNVITALSDQKTQRYYSSTEQLRGSLLYKANLTAPFNGLQLIFSINELPASAGTGVINWLAFILASVLSIGTWLIYRLGVRQIMLVNQQQDFVSAVSHELKTPLTSIRMYGEMLREGWANEEKKKSYYEYIHDESERLSRLISNVLQLARMTRNDLQMELSEISIAELMDTIRSRIISQVEHAGFALNIEYGDEVVDSIVKVDGDFFLQIIINLVDNAIKFSARSDQKQINITATRSGRDEIIFSIRDFGPGIPRNQIKKIFKLFYRSENELTRETVGTGIGLALVHQLTKSMQGQIDVINRDPGVEFRLIFPMMI